MRFYIQASEHDTEDIEFFDLPNAYCHRIKKFIISYDPSILPEDEEDFDSDLSGLQKIFNTKAELVEYLQEAVANNAEAFREARLDSALEKLFPDNGSDNVPSYTQSSPYVVSGYDINTSETPFEDLEFKDPRSAIIAWFEQSDKHPMGVSIDAATIKDAQKLLKWVADNEDQFRTWYNQYNNPYKLEYMVNYCKRHQNDSNLIAFSGDQVEPFSLG